jgi:hypothetical protein
MVDESENSYRRRNHPWTVRAAVLLPVLQAAGYVALCVDLLLPFGWQTGVLSPLQTDAPLLGFAPIAASVSNSTEGLLSGRP